MIYLDLNLKYLERMFGFQAGNINDYTGKSIKEIMESEAAAGNVNAANFEKDVFSSPEEIMEVFNLIDPENRYLILTQLSSLELQKLMPYLSDEAMYSALNYLTKDTMLKVLYRLPQKDLAQICFTVMPAEKFLQKTKESELNAFFDSTKVERHDVIKSIGNLEPYQLCSIMESITGKPVESCQPQQIQEKLSQMDPTQFKKTIAAFDHDVKASMIMNILDQKPDLTQEFSKQALISPFMEMKRDEFLEAMSAMKTDNLLEMMKELPEEVLPSVVSAIDPEDFAKILMTDFKSVLASASFK